MARTRSPDRPTITTDPDRWGPFAACRDHTNLDWVTPDDDDDEILDLDLLTDEQAQVLDALNRRIGVADDQPATRSAADAFQQLVDDDPIGPVVTTVGWTDEQACRTICATCPVRAHCLEWALEWRHTEGILGGLDGYQREHLRRARQLPAHGTSSGYTNDACRCPLCQDAMRIAAADRRNPIVPTTARPAPTAAAQAS